MYCPGELIKCQNCVNYMDEEQPCEVYDEEDIEFDSSDSECPEFEENQTEESDTTPRPLILAGTLICCEGCKHRLGNDSCICHIVESHVFDDVNELCEAKE